MGKDQKRQRGITKIRINGIIGVERVLYDIPDIFSGNTREYLWLHESLC
jgi:hypothetical protein